MRFRSRSSLLLMFGALVASASACAHAEEGAELALDGATRSDSHASTDVGTNEIFDATRSPETDSALADSEIDTGVDTDIDAGFDVGSDAGVDVGSDTGVDSVIGSSLDAAVDSGSPTDAGATAATWSTNAVDHRCVVGATFVYVCPPGGTASSIWGTGEYTDDSSICTAAVHAGKIGLAAGGTVTIQMHAGASSYVASVAFGVSSGSWGSWLCGFGFE